MIYKANFILSSPLYFSMTISYIVLDIWHIHADLKRRTENDDPDRRTQQYEEWAWLLDKM